MTSALLGSTRSAPSPATSGIEDSMEATIGTPAFCASKIGNPNPSYKVGKTKTAAFLSSPTFSCPLTKTGPDDILAIIRIGYFVFYFFISKAEFACQN